MSRLGPYTLLRRIAVGGMAEIFLARREGPAGFAKIVALKRILPHLSGVADFVAMFMDEARLAARLTHPNVVQIYDFGEHGGTYFISMEYVPGEDLLSVLRRARELERPVPPVVAAAILAATCDALHYAHELRDERGAALGIVHRDVTPSNVLISFDGVVKLADFGIAKAEHRSTHTAVGALKGKYAYMSPEQAKGEKLDRRSDLFSLGVAAHELLTGRRLFARDSELAVLKAITEDPVPRPTQHRSDVPAELEAIVMRALERDPERRFASGQAMQLALEDFMAGTGSTGARLQVSHYLRDLFGNEMAIARKRLAAGEVEAVEATSAPSTGAQVDAGVGRAAMPPALPLPLAAEPTAMSTEVDYRYASMPAPPQASGSGGTMAQTAGEATPRSMPGPLGTGLVAPSGNRRGLRLAGIGVGLGILAGLSWYIAAGTTQRPSRPPLATNAGVAADDLAPSAPSGVRPAPAPAEPPAPAQDPKPAAPPAEAAKPVAQPAAAPPAKKDPPKGASPRKAPPRETAFLTIDVTPWAEVLVDGQSIGSTPIARHKIDAGKRTLTLVGRDEGFRVTSTFTVEPGKEHTEKRVLEKGKLACDSEPWAEVYAGTRKLGTTPLAPTALTEGTYTLRLRNPQLGKEKRVKVTITAGGVTRIREKLD